MKQKTLSYGDHTDPGVHSSDALRRDRTTGQRVVADDDRTPAAMLAAFATLWLLLAIAPVSRSDWLLENLLVLIVVPWLIATRRRLRFSERAYQCMFVFLVLHAVGAHFTYSLVPYDRWFESLTGRGLDSLLGFERNHYDRLVHFMYGALWLLPTVELFDRYAPPRGIWRWLMPVLFVTSHSVIYELLEWVAALVVAPSLGDAYLGTQGDVWDAQKDMALASAGAVLAMAIVAARRRSPLVNGR
jgi:putative membrane protein